MRRSSAVRSCLGSGTIPSRFLSLDGLQFCGSNTVRSTSSRATRHSVIRESEGNEFREEDTFRSGQREQFFQRSLSCAEAFRPTHECVSPTQLHPNATKASHNCAPLFGTTSAQLHIHSTAQKAHHPTQRAQPQSQTRLLPHTCTKHHAFTPQQIRDSSHSLNIGTDQQTDAHRG